MQYGYFSTAAFVSAINEHDSQFGVDRYVPILFKNRSASASESSVHIGNKEDNCPPKHNKTVFVFTICAF
jgi:hypothetical protein